MTIAVAKIARFPVKGLNQQPLDQVALVPGKALPHDRRFALAHAAAAAGDGTWHPPASFVTLATQPRLALLDVGFDAETGILTIRRGGRQVARGQATTPLGRMLVNQFFAAFLADDPRGAVRLIEADDIAFLDTPEPSLSLVSRGSLGDLQRITGTPVDPARFRANLMLDGIDPWVEAGWTGKELTIGGVGVTVLGPLEVTETATINPATGQRDLNLAQAMLRAYGHAHCGLRARVEHPGTIAIGDLVTLGA